MRWTKWWLLRWDGQRQAYRVIYKVRAPHAPAALVAAKVAGDPQVIARPQGDRTVPVVGRDA